MRLKQGEPQDGVYFLRRLLGHWKKRKKLITEEGDKILDIPKGCEDSLICINHMIEETKKQIKNCF
jgi:hypothetical protein